MTSFFGLAATLISLSASFWLPAIVVAQNLPTDHIVHVKIDNYTYKPAALSVPVGTTVIWKNLDDEPHTVTANDKLFNSKGMAMGDTWSYRFTKPGTYPYYCTVHPFMKGTVMVEESH